MKRRGRRGGEEKIEEGRESERGRRDRGERERERERKRERENLLYMI